MSEGDLHAAVALLDAGGVQACARGSGLGCWCGRVSVGGLVWEGLCGSGLVRSCGRVGVGVCWRVSRRGRCGSVLDF